MRNSKKSKTTAEISESVIRSQVSLEETNRKLSPKVSETNSSISVRIDSATDASGVTDVKVDNISVVIDRVANIALNKSVLEYYANSGLVLKGYGNASQGQMPVKDATNGISWVTPVSDQSLQEAVAQAQASATQAGTSAVQAGNYAAQAIAAKNYVENKFWYGTMAEYNALETIYNSTIYIILDE